jgi:alpha-galactosidase
VKNDVFLLVWAMLAAVVPAARAADGAANRSVDLGRLELSQVVQGWGTPQRDRAVTELPLRIGGRAFERGLGSHAPGVLHVALDGRTVRFAAWVGIDDGAGERGSAAFQAYGDGRRLFDSGVLRGGQPPQRMELDLHGVRHLALVMTDGGDGADFDHADWADAAFQCEGDPPRIVGAPQEEQVLLTPPPPPRPRLNGPKIYGVRPGAPFLFRIPATGERPMRFSATDLPAGLALDRETGILTGVIRDRTEKTWTVTLAAENALGTDERVFRIVVGDRLALTPPMGWNSWYIHYDRVTEEHLRGAADAMLASGMADFGYQYVNIDDCWMKRRGEDPPRDPQGMILPNAKFPDIRGMVEYIHGLGLKAGTYISPGPWTCAGYTGSFGFEAQDARQFAAWGFDFLKYDWCSYEEVATGEGRERLIRPYRIMADALRAQPRDIVLNLCQYGMGDVWEWGGEVGHGWRTTGDLGLEGGGLLPGFYSIGLRNARYHAFAGPGHWNDPDYILIGWVGDARHLGEGQPTSLTPNEQYAYMSMWSLMAAPLIFSGDMAKLDPFTLNVLCNHEVIDINQDPLGSQARIIRQSEQELVLAKPLEDGDLAVGLFNLTETPQILALAWEEIGLAAPHDVRDVWRQVPITTAATQIQTDVPRHGVAFFRLRPIP